MRVQKWQVQLAGLMLLLTAVFYAARWLLFPAESLHSEMLRFLLGDIAFLFLQVLLVTVFIDRVTREREREEIRQKLNMVVGAFFSEAGTSLLGKLALTDASLPAVRNDLVARMSWKPADYSNAKQAFRGHEVAIHLTAADLAELKQLLSAKKSYLLGLLGNQSLLEHERFSDLLWAVTHVAEELEARRDLSALTRPDSAHIEGDVKRAYLLLGETWIEYLQHLQVNYPYLFSLAVRTNPLDPSAHVEIAE